MKANAAALLCLAIVPLIASCKIGYYHRAYSSSTTTSTINDEEYTTTLVHDNGREECSYSFKTKGYAYTLKSTGPLKISNGTVQNLHHGQLIHLVVTEDARDYPYTIANGNAGITIQASEGALTDADEARVRKALERAEKQITGNQQRIDTARKQVRASQAQIKATQAQMQRQAEALQRQAEAMQKQAQRQAEAMQKQAQQLQKQAEEMQRRMAQ